jgi:hypothetical protein
MSVDFDEVQSQLPFYLSAEDKKALLTELQALIAGGAAGFILSPQRDEFATTMLQGDGWAGFQHFLFESGERRDLKRGLVLSNSCDVDPANQRDVPTRIAFAPLVKLSAFEKALHQAGIDAKKIASKLADIRAQRITSMFFLPAGGAIEEDLVSRLDELHSMPLTSHLENKARSKLFTLSNAGFYLLTFKLSVHFCRLQEKVNRRSAMA